MLTAPAVFCKQQRERPLRGWCARQGSKPFGGKFIVSAQRAAHFEISVVNEPVQPGEQRLGQEVRIDQGEPQHLRQELFLGANLVFLAEV
jgi:hypothetical protein